METIESIHSDFVADVCLTPDVEFVRIRFEHPDISGTIFIKNNIKKHTISKDVSIIKSFLNVIKKYVYETHYKTFDDDNSVPAYIIKLLHNKTF